MRTNSLLGFLLLQEIFDNSSIPAVPFLAILAVLTPFILVGAGIKRLIVKPRAKFPEEIADEALVDRYRKGESVDAYELRLAEGRLYNAFYNIKAIDTGAKGALR